MNIGSVCTRQVVTVERHDSLQRAAQRMREQHVGALVIVEGGPEAAQVVGIVTDRDLAIEVLARGVDASQVPVGEFGAARLVSVDEDGDLIDAVALMQAAGVRRLLVRNAAGDLVGLLSFDDLLQACVQPLTGLAEVLRKGFEREAHLRGALAAAPRAPVRVPAVGTAGWTGR